MHGNPACRRRREVILCDYGATYGRYDAGMHLHIRTRYWFSLDCEDSSTQLGCEHVSRFRRCLSHYLLCCFIHVCMHGLLTLGIVVLGSVIHHTNVLIFTHRRLPWFSDNLFSGPLFLTSLSLPDSEALWDGRYWRYSVLNRPPRRATGGVTGVRAKCRRGTRR
ncbi:hypothetical protein EDB86DRAFT_2872665 [Lactarius hatsudake]|nr:hypothetical protein EDB86DRAFT_2872665 [Lactarius hatsudake]